MTDDSERMAKLEAGMQRLREALTRIEQAVTRIEQDVQDLMALKQRGIGVLWALSLASGIAVACFLATWEWLRALGNIHG